MKEVILGDGILDVMNSNDILNICWGVINQEVPFEYPIGKKKASTNWNEIAKICSSEIVTSAMKLGSTDNVTAIVILFYGLKKSRKKYKKESKKSYVNNHQ